MTSDNANDVQLRLGGPADADAIRTLTRAAYAAWVPLLGREPKPMTADYAAAVIAHRFDLADRDGAPVALIETRAEPGHLLIVNLAVAPAWQSRGIGRRLLAHAEQLAREAGLSTLRLYTNAAFARNIALYGRFGYRIDREESRPWGVTVHMVKTLAAEPPRRR